MTTLLSSTSIPPPSRVDVVAASESTTTTSPRTSPRRSVSQLRLPKIIEEDGTQRILNVGIPNNNRCNNILITSKYTVWTFLPLVRYYVGFTLFTLDFTFIDSLRLR
jgi:hypothetical protein